jgi:hypothetical protein
MRIVRRLRRWNTVTSVKVYRPSPAKPSGNLAPGASEPRRLKPSCNERLQRDRDTPVEPEVASGERRRDAMTTRDPTMGAATPASLFPVLIAEDDPASRRLLEATLRRWGHEVMVTADGDEAWGALQRMPRPSPSSTG